MAQAVIRRESWRASCNRRPGSGIASGVPQVSELAGFFVVAGHFQQTFGSTDRRAVFYPVGRRDFMGGQEL